MRSMGSSCSYAQVTTTRLGWLPPWVTRSWNPMASDGSGAYGLYALLDNRGALGGRCLGDSLGHIPAVPSLALAAGLQRSDRPALAAGKGASEEYHEAARQA